MLPEHTADPPLGQFHLGTEMIDAGTAMGGAQKFCCQCASEPGVFRFRILQVRPDLI